MIKTVLCFPVPIETKERAAEFRPFIQRFCESLRRYSPGCEYELAAVFNGGPDFGEHHSEIAPLFDGLPVTFHHYEGHGCDIGSFIFAATQFKDRFMVCCSSRVYAWKDGWLRRLVEARETFGPALYGTSWSRESGRSHICGRCFGIDAEDLALYPLVVDRREACTEFEIGEHSLTNYFWDNHKPTYMVYWDGVCDFTIAEAGEDLHFQTAPNIYRVGSQENLLVFDKHSDYFRDASKEEQVKLAQRCFVGP